MPSRKTNKSSLIKSIGGHNPIKRIEYLDGLRGLAALVVVFSHYVSMFWPAMHHPSNAVSIHTRFDQLVYDVPFLQMFISGSFAVQIFFVLSGFVLANKAFRSKGSLVKQICKRYFRLLPLVVFSIALSWLFVRLNWYSGMEVSRDITGSIKEGGYFAADKSFLFAMKQAFFDVFTKYVDPKVSFNNSLWTMYYELAGSYLVMTVAAALKSQKGRFIAYVLIVTVMYRTYFAPFFIGMILADLYVNKPDFFDSFGKIHLLQKVILFLASIIIGTIPTTLLYSQGSIHQALMKGFETDSAGAVIVWTWVGASIMVLMVLSFGRFQKLLSMRPMLFLGKLSFSMYVIHKLVLFSAATSLFMVLYKDLGYNLAAIVSTVFGLIITLIVSHLLAIGLDEPAVKYVNKSFAKIKWFDKS